ncbi:hypothetical protein JNUCC64_20755 [Streptomyces sp. JNUCC 64]
MSERGKHHSESQAARKRRYVSKRFLSSQAEHLIGELARPLEDLSPADAAALVAGREAVARAEREVSAFVGGRAVELPMPGFDQNGLPLPRDGLEEWAVGWAGKRVVVSTRVVGELARDRADGLPPPLRQVVIGGGASLAGRNGEALLVDDVGRWHLDLGVGLVQSADQDRNLAQTMGVSTYAAVKDPRDRVPVSAVRGWEDQLAVQGDVVNGRARLRLGDGGTLFAEIVPKDWEGRDPLWVACDGPPVVATGLTTELVPGMARGVNGVESRSEALRLLGTRLGELAAQGTEGAAELRGLLVRAERGGADTATVCGLLESSPLGAALRTGPDGSPDERLGNCFTALDATRKWERAREEAPGRALMGDEVAEGRFNAGGAQHWIIAGSGGTGVANAEIILQENPDARVTIIGNGMPPALEHQVQYPELLRDHGEGSPDPRFRFVRAELGEVRTAPGPDGEPVFEVPYRDENGQPQVVRADGYVANLGRSNPLPPAVQSLADEVRDRGGRISGDLLFDRDDQYIGYGITFAVDGHEHRVDVDGAASWQLPRELFPPETGLQADLMRMGARALPAETGNAAPGFAPVARQSALRARAVAQERAGDPDAVRRRSTIPERWRPPRRGTGPATAEPSAPTGPTAPPRGNDPRERTAPDAPAPATTPTASPAPDAPAPTTAPTASPAPGTAPVPAPANPPAAPKSGPPKPGAPKPDTPAVDAPPPRTPAWTGPALWHAGIPRATGPRPAPPAPTDRPPRPRTPPERPRPTPERPRPTPGTGTGTGTGTGIGD